MPFRRLLLTLAAITPVLAAGCGGAHRTATGPTLAKVTSSLDRQLDQAGCSTQVAAARPLAVHPSFLTLPGPPFGVAVTPDGRWSFVDEITGQVAVLSNAGPEPHLLRTITLPQQAIGSSVTSDGRYLLVADGTDGATVISVQRAVQGSPNPVLGTLTRSPGQLRGGAIEVTSSRDGRDVFVSLETADQLAVYDLGTALADNFKKSGYVGAIRMGVAPVGMAISPDGRWMYATSEGGVGAFRGTVKVIDVATAERDPARAVLATARAQCSPVRVVVAAGGRTVWVTARESDQVLAFSATKLRTDPAHALLTAVRVGEAPVGLALVDGGRDLVVADSNRFGSAGARAQLTVLSTPAALAHRPAILGTVPAGSFPREMALEPDGRTLLVGNFGSDQVEAVGVAGLR